MPILTPYFATTSADRLLPRLRPAVQSAVKAILELLDAHDGRAQVARILESLFPLVSTQASKNASLNSVLHEFNEAAEAAGVAVRMEITKAKSVGPERRWVWFEGPALGPQAQRTPDLAAIQPDRVLEQRGLPLEPVVVLLTVNAHETAAVLRAFLDDQTPPTQTKGGITYNLLGRVGGNRVVHTVCEMGSGGVGATLSRTYAAITAWRPRAVIAVGIAFGVDERKQRIGDVLVSTHIRPYEHVRVNTGGALTPRGSRPDASPTMLNRLRLLDQSTLGPERLHWPRLHFGVVLSGEKLVDDLDYRQSLRANFEAEAIGGEMEAAGLYTAAFEAKVDWIVVKAICDWADGKKSTDKEYRQGLAAQNAALVVKRALEGSGLFDGPGREPGEPRAGRRAVPDPSCLTVPAVGRMGLKDILSVTALEEETRAVRTTLHKDRPEDPTEGEAAEVAVLDYLLAWLKEAGAPPLFALLGEYGMGKTITCQRLARELDRLRQSDAALPVPLYFDLRNVTGLRDAVPGLRETVEQCILRGWHATDEAFGITEFERLVDQGALVIFDGLDEVLVKLSEADGHVFTNQLVKLLSDARERRRRAGTLPGPEPRLLISCRTQYFRTLRDQRTHFTGQERGDHGPDACRAMVLTPFTEAQVRRYLVACLPGADPVRLIDLIRSVHNLQDLSRRPFTLKLVADFIPEIEADRAAGRVVNGVTLYRRMVQRWLDRDLGKHHVQPEHKLRLAAHLAAEMLRSGQGVLPASRLEAWFHRWLEEQPDLRPRYSRLPPDQLEEDLRTATFLTRQDGEDDEQSGFRFAHTSLQEFFLADYLLDALRQDLPERWKLPRPSVETLDFLGQMLAEGDGTGGLGTMQRWRRTYREDASELILAYALRAQQRGWPRPILHGMDLRGAKLRGWRIGRLRAKEDLDLGPTCLTGADLRQARLYGAQLSGADLRGARLDQTEFHGCDLQEARFDDAQADGAVFRRCRMGTSKWEGVRSWRIRFVEGAPSVVPPGSVLAPLPELTPRDRRQLALLGGHEGGVSSCAFSPDGARLLSAGEDGTLRLWDAISGEEFRVLTGHLGSVWSCAFSPDGARLLSAGGDGTLRLWDAHSGEEVRVVRGHRGGVRSCTFSPDSTLFLSGSDDCTLRLWGATSGEEVRVLRGHRGGVRSCAFSPDGARLLSASGDRTLRLWNANSGEELQVLRGHRGGVGSCAFSPDGAQLLSAGGDRTLRLWDANSGEKLQVLRGHQGWVRSCAFSPDGARLLSAGDDGTMRLWDTHSGEELRVITRHRRSVKSCAFSPDGARLSSAGDDGALQLWNANSGEELRVLTSQWRSVRTCAYSPDGARILSAGYDGTLRLWDASTGEALRVSTKHQGAAMSCTVSPDCTRILSAGYDGTIRLWDAKSGKELQVLRGHQGGVGSCVFSPDGAHLLSVGEDGTLRLWDAGSGEELRVLRGHRGWIGSCAFSPDGAQLLSVGEDGTLRLWDASSGEELRVLRGHRGWAWSCTFSPDGNRLLSAGSNGALRLWDATSGEECMVLSGHQGGVRSCAFSPDGAQLLSVGEDGTLRLWDATSGEERMVLSGHQGPVRSCTFSPDGTRLLSAGEDGTLRLWDANTGECLRIHATLSGHHAVWEPATSRVIEATDGAWRWLQWQIWEPGDGWMPIPLESFGPVPAPRRLATT